MMKVIRFNLGALILVISTKGISETGGAQHMDRRSVLQDSFLTKSLPEFDTIQPQNVSALVGKTAFLTCVVRNLKPTQRVSWVRHRDVHILTAGEQTFTSDQRFSAKHNSDDEWVLVIKYIQVESPPDYLSNVALINISGGLCFNIPSTYIPTRLFILGERRGHL